ncbi:hypothetical protein TR74_07145, partial [Carbonactinospora thermoautotrophica]
MTETPQSGTGAEEAPRVCKRPGCSNLVPAREPGQRGRPPVFCSPECATRYHNARRYAEPQPGGPGESAGPGGREEPQAQDPLTQLTRIARQLGPLVQQVVAQYQQVAPDTV